LSIFDRVQFYHSNDQQWPSPSIKLPHHTTIGLIYSGLLALLWTIQRTLSSLTFTAHPTRHRFICDQLTTRRAMPQEKSGSSKKKATGDAKKVPAKKKPTPTTKSGSNKSGSNKSGKKPVAKPSTSDKNGSKSVNKSSRGKAKPTQSKVASNKPAARQSKKAPEKVEKSGGGKSSKKKPTAVAYKPKPAPKV